MSRRIKKKSLGGKLKIIRDYSYDIYLMHTPYAAPVVTRFARHYIGNQAAVIALTVACGIVFPMLLSTLIIRRVKLLRRNALGMWQKQYGLRIHKE